MASNIYKVYAASDYDNLDLAQFQDNVRWRVDGTQFIVEFINTPVNTTGTLTQPDARALMLSPEWAEPLTDSGFPE